MQENFSHLALLDGAIPAAQGVSQESLALSAQTQDPSLSLVDRIESYEDIINLEIGDTSMTRARNLEREHSIRQVYLKFEGSNPTGTQKDRIAFMQCHDALRRGFDSKTSDMYDCTALREFQVSEERLNRLNAGMEASILEICVYPVIAQAEMRRLARNIRAWAGLPAR